jgi:hypothetical protein
LRGVVETRVAGRRAPKAKRRQSPRLRVARRRRINGRANRPAPSSAIEGGSGTVLEPDEELNDR